MIKKYIFSSFLALISIVSLFFTIEKVDIISIIVSILIVFLFIKQKIHNNIFIFIPSLILTIFTWLQYSLPFIWSNELVPLKLILSPIGYLIFFTFLISFLYDLFDKNTSSHAAKSISNIKLFIISFCIIFILWIPAWIAEYPNSISPDAMAQFGQIFNVQPYSNGNPLIHTFIIKFLFSFFSLFTKDININIGCISMVFTIINALVFAYVSVYVYKRANKLSLYIASIAFFSLISFNVFYGIQISKDTGFSIFTLLFIIFVDKYFKQQNLFNTISILIIGLFFALFRYNGYYIIIGMLVILIPFIKKKQFRKIGILLLILFILSYIIRTPIYNQITSKANSDLITTTKSKKGISVSTKNIIPLQQISYIVYRDWGLTDKQKSLIEKFAPLYIIRENYDMYFADPMLKVCDEYGDKSFYQVDKSEYYKLYFELFFKHPFDFIEAYCGMTNIYFFPYIGELNHYSTNMADNEFGFKKIRLISGEYSTTVENIYHSQYKIPLVNLLLSPGIYTFFIIIVLFYFLYSKQYNKFYLLTPLVINILILITVVPINGEFRYYLPISVCLPLIISLILSEKETI